MMMQNGVSKDKEQEEQAGRLLAQKDIQRREEREISTAATWEPSKESES